MHKYNVIPIFFLLEVDKVITKVHMEKYTYKQNIEKEELWELADLSDIKTYYKASIIKAEWYWGIDWNGMEWLKIDLNTYGTLWERSHMLLVSM